MSNIKIVKSKIGTWKPRTVYYAYVDDYCVGRYTTQKDAQRAAEAHIENDNQQWRSLAEEFSNE